MAPFLVLNRLTHRREGTTVLQDLTWSSDAKRIGLVGRNGSGKSSLARLLIGLESPTSGALQVFGGAVAEDRAFALAHVGMIFQNPDHQIIFPTVGEEIAFGLENLGLKGDDVVRRSRAMMARFQAETWMDRPVHGLSHGQKHLVCLMAVLAMEPRAIVLDEPYAGLDLPTAAAMRRLLDDLDQHIVLVSHQPRDFDGFDEMLWLDEGRIRKAGACNSVLPAYEKAMRDASQAAPAASVSLERA